ncbi:hypothetical protein SHELI_v1c05950 [Spiroplasma helicoides]|uniref:Uncharacterized protein n=1 Tax=Spiroplasma helicoides TaxID=216938 RepID=A0A1B3SKU3_9MOLU|nr:LD-carboxypeptidase [Spiroplasma helicoides]AOG60546.1 hypothetical protein SHELI_v1c05950 [Spiroplasma helicoides]
MKLGLYHPSDFINDNEFEYELAQKFFVKKGFKIIKPNEDSIKHGLNVALAFEFNKMISRKPYLVLPTYCFENTNSFLDLIDYKAIKQSKAIFCGNSYTTSILSSIFNKTGNSTFYGPNFIRQFNQVAKNEIYADLIDSITNKVSFKGNYDKDNILQNEWLFDGKGEITGYFYGGEIESIIKIWNTEYIPKISSKTIFYIDGIINDRYKILSFLNFFKQKQIFSKCKAVIFAKSLVNDEELKKMVDSLLIGSKKANVVYGVEGMFSEKMIIWKLNAKTTINFSKKTIYQQNY